MARLSFTATPGDRYYDEPHCTEEKLRHTSAQDDTGGKRQSQDLKAHVVSSKVECHRACPWHQGGQGSRGLLRNWKEGDGVYHKETQQHAALGPAPQLPALALRQLGLEYRTGRRQASQGHVSGMCVVCGPRSADCCLHHHHSAACWIRAPGHEGRAAPARAAGSISQPSASLQTSLS